MNDEPILLRIIRIGLQRSEQAATIGKAKCLPTPLADAPRPLYFTKNVTDNKSKTG